MGPGIPCCFGRDALGRIACSNVSADTSIDSGTTGDVPRRLEAIYRPTRTLAKAIGEGLPPHHAARVALRIATAVAELHAGGAVHGALSPSAISLGAHDRIAFTAADEPVSTLGRLRYASPEVARGEEPTSASDVFSLSLILRELLEGRPVRTGTGDDVAIDAIDGRVSVPHGLDGELRELALLAASQHADQRPSALDWVDALARFRHSGLWRSSKRILFGTAAITVGLLAFVLRTSVVEHDRTELQYDEAREVIHGLLTGTFGELDRVATIEPLAAAGARALADIEEIDEADRRSPADRELLARMLLWNGKAQRVCGNLEEAKGLFTRAAARSVDVIDDRAAATIELHAVTSLGEMARDERDLVAAHTFFKRALEVGEARFADGETDRDLRIAYAYTLIRYGDLSMSTGRQSAKRALQIYRKARMVIDDKVAGIGPRDREALELRAELDKLEANMAWQAGQRERAVALLGSHVKRAESLIEMDPGLPRRRSLLAKGARSLALVQRETGALQAAVTSLRTSVEAWRLLREMEPDRIEWRRDWARTTRLLADALSDVGEWQESSGLHDVSVALLDGMLESGDLPAAARLDIGTQLLDAAQGQVAAGNLRRARGGWKRAVERLGETAPSKRAERKWSRARGRSKVIDAELLLAEGRWVAAEERALEFVAELQGGSTPGEAMQLRRERVRALLVVSAVRAMNGDGRVARDTRERALAITEELLIEKPIDPEVMALKTRVLFVLGRDEEAIEMLDELDAIGYRALQLNAVRAAISALRR